MSTTYTRNDLRRLRQALASGERRISFGDKTVEYRSVGELLEAIRQVERALARSRPARQVRVTTRKGF
jgi:hypothetical protein